MNIRYWLCTDCNDIIRFTLVTNQVGQCHAEAGKLVTLHFKTDPWRQIIGKFFRGNEALVAQGIMRGVTEHSWVEIGDQAYDTNYGAIFDRKRYYRLYEISNIMRYTAAQFTKQLVSHEHYCYFGGR